MERRRNPLLLGLGAATAVLPSTLLIHQINLVFAIPVLIGTIIFGLGLLRTPGSKLVLPAIALAVVGWFGPFFLMSYLSRPGPPIRFLVPTGFQGTIELIRDRADGQPLQFDHGRCIFVMPAAGVLRIKEAYVFHHWHTEDCLDAAGKQMLLKSQGTSGGTHVTGPHSMGGSTDDDGTVYRWEVRYRNFAPMSPAETRPGDNQP